MDVRINNTQTAHSGSVYSRDYVIDYTRLERDDLMGNTRYYTKANGQSYAELTYDAWGMPESPNKLLNNDHGNYVYATYTGHIFDTTLDIYFAEARFYDANTRTWLAMDPIKDGDNWYQYCYSNPLKYWDPTGLKGFSLFGCNDINDITDWFHSNAKGMQRVLQGLGGVLQTAGSAAQIYMGVSALATAITAIALSASVSIPILIATIAGGTATIAFGGSNLVEGLHNIINAIKGDAISGFNPIRDTLFEDYPWLYGLLNLVAGTASSVGSGVISSSIPKSGLPSGYYQDANGRWHRPNGQFASNVEIGKINTSEHYLHRPYIRQSTIDAVNANTKVNYKTGQYMMKLVENGLIRVMLNGVILQVMNFGIGEIGQNHKG